MSKLRPTDFDKVSLPTDRYLDVSRFVVVGTLFEMLLCMIGAIATDRLRQGDA